MKKILTSFIFCAIVIILFFTLDKIAIVKNQNRYFMLDEEIRSLDENFDMLVFGSCHAYTSFNPLLMEEEYGISGYNAGNSGEIMPSTYLSIIERIKQFKPKTILVETWGIQAYDTYLEKETIFDHYFPTLLSTIPFSIEKKEVIDDFDSLDIFRDNIALIKYKSRFIDNEIGSEDFNYSFEKVKQLYYDINPYFYEEMDIRLTHNGFKETESAALPGYEEVQMSAMTDRELAIEEDLMKYIDKIIDLCEEEGINLIFYRAPYLSKDTEFMKSNYLNNYLINKGVPFYDLEKELILDYEQDFSDKQHLSS